MPSFILDVTNEARPFCGSLQVYRSGATQGRPQRGSFGLGGRNQLYGAIPALTAVRERASLKLLHRRMAPFAEPPERVFRRTKTNSHRTQPGLLLRETSPWAMDLRAYLMCVLSEVHKLSPDRFSRAVGVGDELRASAVVPRAYR